MKSLHQTIASAAVAAALVLPLAASAYTNPVELSAGNMVTSRMNSTIDSGSAHVGDKFSMTVLTPYPSNNGVYSNGQLYGHVTSVTAAQRRSVRASSRRRSPWATAQGHASTATSGRKFRTGRVNVASPAATPKRAYIVSA